MSSIADGAGTRGPPNRDAVEGKQDMGAKEPNWMPDRSEHPLLAIDSRFKHDPELQFLSWRVRIYRYLTLVQPLGDV
ncbi:hypothetical protein ISF_04252 [Cordyceps fumosorosea ARSEF 2679]|uniref:Uncharacterized protein n=1 Tax=Cordyceps fumosorosea (strain ARSEF 2679) TaxID=1081104 RepID=A0A162J7G0_CORFA|nr:hypothetical protein ISF_04252 [Cordyceps fumosorosea ARSEF 2679]OAA64842.1 hypothetical protein ISF_04252 [Cordyceps fumosorosea ARSEF 2679]